MSRAATEAERDRFFALVEQTDRLLWKTYDLARNKTITDLTNNLRFPAYRSGGIRVSEQEARFVLASLLATTPGFLYTVETPTLNEYQQTGQGAISARPDITPYVSDGTPLFHVEFKEGGFRDDRQDHQKVKKDIEKLLREGLDGFWFHTLEGVNNSTLREVWLAFLSDLRAVADQYKTAISPKLFVFHACVLRQRFSIQRRFLINPADVCGTWLQDLQPIEYEVSREELLNVTAGEGWTVTKP